MYNDNYGGYGASSGGAVPPDLTPYWKTDGSSSPATGQWQMGNHGFANWTGSTSIDTATQLGLGVGHTTTDSIAGLLLEDAGYARIFGGNFNGDIYASLECYADGHFVLSGNNLSNTTQFTTDPLTGKLSFTANGAVPGYFGYDAVNGIEFKNAAAISSFIDPSDVTVQTKYKLPPKTSGVEVFAMQSDILLLTLYGI